MCRLQFDRPEMEVSDWDLTREGKSYTIHTLEALRQKHPGAALYLCMGADMFLTLHQWKDFSRYPALCQFAVLPRGQEDRQALLCQQGRLPGHSEILEQQVLDVSSRQIRAMLQRGEDASGFLHPAVMVYIYKHGLYVSGDENRKE